MHGAMALASRAACILMLIAGFEFYQGAVSASSVAAHAAAFIRLHKPCSIAAARFVPPLGSSLCCLFPGMIFVPHHHQAIGGGPYTLMAFLHCFYTRWLLQCRRHKKAGFFSFLFFGLIALSHILVYFYLLLM